MTVSLLLILAGLGCMLLGLRRRNAARVQHLPTFKPTPWDEFRSRVVQATGCPTVHAALAQGQVETLPGGWLIFDGLAHHADEEQTAADLAQARLDAALRDVADNVDEWCVEPAAEPEAPTRDPFPRKAGEFRVGDVVNATRSRGVKVTRVGRHNCLHFDNGRADYADACTLVTPVEAAEPAPSPVSPWVGRKVHKHGVCTGAHDGWLQFGVREAWGNHCELDWSDVRAGDRVQYRDGETYAVTDVFDWEWFKRDGVDVGLRFDDNTSRRFLPPVVKA